MQRSNSNAMNQSVNLSQSASSSSASVGNQGLKNLAAMHELMTRQGFYLPDFTASSSTASC